MFLFFSIVTIYIVLGNVHYEYYFAIFRTAIVFIDVRFYISEVKETPLGKRKTFYLKNAHGTAQFSNSSVSTKWHIITFMKREIVAGQKTISRHFMSFNL